MSSPHPTKPDSDPVIRLTAGGLFTAALGIVASYFDVDLGRGLFYLGVLIGLAGVVLFMAQEARGGRR